MVIDERSLDGKSIEIFLKLKKNDKLKCKVEMGWKKMMEKKIWIVKRRNMKEVKEGLEGIIVIDDIDINGFLRRNWRFDGEKMRRIG